MKSLYLILIFQLFFLPVSFSQPEYTDTTFYISSELISEIDRAEQVSHIHFYDNEKDTSWLFFLLIFCMLIYSSVKFAFSKEFSATIKAFTNFKIAQQLYRDREIIQNIPAILLNLGFIITSAILIYQLTIHLGIDEPSKPLTFIMIAAITISVIMAVRVNLILFLGWLFPIKSATNYYAFNIMLANRVNGLVLLPLLFIVSFSSNSVAKPILILSIVVALMFYIYKLVRGYVLAKDFFQKHKFHIILYICTFEISPVLVFAKLFTDNWHKFIT